MLEPKMKFGAFMPPVHGIKENPTLAIERDLQLVEHMDKLGYDEVWVGEHHSAGAELVGSPELFIAAAAQRTQRIKLGTGVVTLPYQHPLILADRMNQLDHMTRGRTMFGMGPGALVADAYMQGLEPGVLRDRMDESIDVIVRLMRGETVDAETDWFKCVNARLQMNPYSRPSIEMATANNVSPTGAKAAGRHGLSMLSLGATTHKGFNALAANWNIVEESAAEHGQTVSRDNWRLVGPMHIAETREQALEEVKFGIGDWVHYYTEVANIPIVEKGVDPLKAVLDTGMAVIGTPEDAIERLQSLKESSGGFGTFLFMDVNWANFANKLKSYEMFARYVMPELQQLNDNRVASQKWVQSNSETFTAGARAAVGSRILQHLEEKGVKNLNPEMVQLMKNHQNPRD